MAELPRCLDDREEELEKEPLLDGDCLCCHTQRDQELDQLMRLRKNMAPDFENRACANPYGQSCYDFCSLYNDRVKCALECTKMEAKVDDHKYLQDHPELDAMIQLVIRNLIRDQPNDPVKYMAEFFCYQNTSYECHLRRLQAEIIEIKKHRAPTYSNVGKEVNLQTIRSLNLGPFAGMIEKKEIEVNRKVVCRSNIRNGNEEENCLNRNFLKCCCCCCENESLSIPSAKTCE